MKATIYKINPITGRRIAKLFEDTLSNLGYAGLKDVRDSYFDFYGKEKIELIIK